MNTQLENLMYQAGLTAQGCWDAMDEYDRQAIQKFAELIVRECVVSIPSNGHRGDFGRAVEFCQQQIKKHFGIEN